MNIRSFIILPAIAFTLIACQQSKTSNVNESVFSSADSADSDSINPDSVEATEQAGDRPDGMTQLIVSGKSIGQISINESGENVHKQLGKPDGGDAAMGKSISIWYANHDTTSFVTKIYFSRGHGNDEIKRVKQIRVTSPFFKLRADIYTGKPLMKAKALYQLEKVATFTERGHIRILYDDLRAGIAFDVDDKDLITGLTVHEPGRSVSTTYLDFFSDLKLTPGGQPAHLATVASASSIGLIRQKVEKINSASLRKTHVEFMCDEMMKVDHFYLNDEIVKISVDYGTIGDVYSREDYYFDNQKLIFLYEFVEGGPACEGCIKKHEYRSYVSDDKVFKYLKDKTAQACRKCDFGAKSKQYKLLNARSQKEIKTILCR